MSKLTYKKSGVDVDQANRFIEMIKPGAKKTKRPGVVGGLGGFGALFKPPVNQYKNPLLVSSADGVGTKLLAAKENGKFDVLGQDLVAMNVNDIITCGAEPLYFMDYFAVGKLQLDYMNQVMRGMVSACEEASCALIGGETAEMPDLYKDGDFDLAGFAVGIVEESELIDGSGVKAGDVIIGCASNGFHANGFSMIRKVFDKAFIRENATEILKPTKLYVQPVRQLMKKVEVKAMAHITGGGFYDNIPRVLPKGTGAVINAESWKIPTVFQWLKDKANTSFKELYRTFNMGIGFVAVVSQEESRKALSSLSKSGVDAWIIGAINAEEGVKIQ